MAHYRQHCCHEPPIQIKKKRNENNDERHDNPKPEMPAASIPAALTNSSYA
jgi:hypothetical protein